MSTERTVIETGQMFIFTSPYDQYRARVGQQATVLGEVDRSTIDYAETGSLYRVRFADGTMIQAWPEEIDPANERTEQNWRESQP